MKTLDDIMVKMGQLDSLLYSIEGEMIAVEVGGEDMKRMSNLFYLLVEQMGQVKADMEEVSGHIKVCNAIFAVNHCEALRQEIAELKAQLAQTA